MTEKTERDIARETATIVRSCISIAVHGAANNPQEGVDYLPTDEEARKVFEAHPWVKNAVLMGFNVGCFKGMTSPRNFGLDADDMRLTSLTVVKGHDLFAQMEKYANEVV